MPTDIVLQEPDRQKLDGIVQKMIANKETDDTIQLVVNDFKQKYGKKQDDWYTAGRKKAFNPGMFLGPLGQIATKKGREQLTEGAKLVVGSTANIAARAGVSLVKGATGLAGKNIVPEAGFNLPFVGNVKPFANSQNSVTTALAQKLGQRFTPEQIAQSKQSTNSQALSDIGTAATSYLEVGAPGLGKLLKKPITALAEKLYQSALKPSTKLAPEVVKEMVETGLNENIWLTKGGVEGLAGKIEKFENTIGEAIENAKGQGTTISLEGLQSYVDEVKDFFKYDVDTKAAEQAVKELDDLVKNFRKTYGKEIPIEVAQKVKVKTGQQLAKYYDRMTSVGVEGRKQVTRFLKDKIVEKAPVVGDVNAKLKALYKLDEQLSKATNRIGNNNIFSLGGKVLTGTGAAVGGLKGAAIGAAGSILSGPAFKSGAAITMNTLVKGGAKAAGGVRIPVTAALNKAFEKRAVNIAPSSIMFPAR